MAAKKPHPSKASKQADILKKVGRPTTYDDERIEKEADALLEWIKDAADDDKKIFLGSFAVERGFTRKRLSEWADSNEKFRDAYDKGKEWQTLKFVKNGLTRKWDPGFTQYVMARVCSPEWKRSWDAPEEKVDDKPTTVIINKIEK